MMTGCRQMKGCITVSITSRVVRISRFDLFDLNCMHRKRTVPQ